MSYQYIRTNNCRIHTTYAKAALELVPVCVCCAEALYLKAVRVENGEVAKNCASAVKGMHAAVIYDKIIIIEDVVKTEKTVKVFGENREIEN